MLKELGRLIEKRPWLIIGIIFMITIGFGTLVPFLDTGTTTEDFLPDDDIVKANERVTDFFGGTDKLLLIYAQNQNSESAITPESLKEEYQVLKNLEKIEEVKESTGIAIFIDLICQIEFNKTLFDCSNDEINTAVQDFLSEKNYNEIQMMTIDDNNEDIDYNPYPKISRGKTIDSIDIKNYYIQEIEENLVFSIEVYDLSHFESKLNPPHSKMNVLEWFISFKNLIIPDERLDINYKISAHIEPTSDLWEVGNGPVNNFKGLIDLIKSRELFKSYKKEAYLWIQAPGQDMSFPIKLESGNVTLNTVENKVEIQVDKRELGKYGISPEMYGAGLPARIGDSKAGFRFYQIPKLKLPWMRLNFDIEFLNNYFEKIQDRPLLKSITEKIMSKIGDFAWEDFDEVFSLMDDVGLSVEKIALKDMETWWIVTDESPDTGFSEKTFFIKPFFIEELKNNAIIFLSEDYKDDFKPSGTLMLLSINESVGAMQSGEVSKKIVKSMERFDSEKNYVSMEATGAGVITYQIDDLTEEANMIILPGIFIAICIILFINFRKLSYIILPIVGLSISVIWLIGTMVLFGIRFNTMYVALIPLLMGLGVDYSVHMFHNYRAELEKGKTPGKAIATSIKEVGTAMFLAALTTVIAFLSFLTASIAPLRDFGVLCALGIIYTFITTITLQASIRYVLDRREKVADKLVTKKKNNKKNMKDVSKIVYKYSGVFLIVACIFTGIMFLGAINVKTGFDTNDFLPEDNPAMNIWDEIDEKFPFSSQSQEFILIEGNVASVDTLNGISQTNTNLLDDELVAKKPDGNIKVTSTLSIIQDAVRENKSIETEFNLDNNGIPESDQDVKRIFDFLYDHPNYFMDMRGVLHREKGSYDASVIRVYIDFSKSNKVHEVKREIMYSDLNGDIADYGDASAIVTGAISMNYAVTLGLTQSQIISTAISIVIATIVLIIAYRSPLLGLITSIPVVISIIWILASSK